MSKITRHLKKNKRNRTIKRIKRGGQVSKSTENKVEAPEKERQGIIDIIGDKIGDVVSSAATNVGDAGLKIIGLERVDKVEEEEKKEEQEEEEKKEEEKSSEKVDNNIQKISDATSGIISDVGNVVDKTGSAIIENVNEVLGSDAVKETTEQAAEKTADIIKDGAETFNEALNDPEVKAELKEAIENAGEVGEVVVEAAKKPIEKAVDVTADSVSKASGAALAGFIKVGTDAMAAVPGVGAVIEVGKMLNDGSKAASAVVEAGSEAVEVASDAFIETKENVDKGLKILEEKKKIGEQISSRTSKSIKDFENPVTSQAGGGRKTTRRLLNRKHKSKKVRFSI